MTTETDVLFFTPKYIDQVWKITSDTMLRSALQRRDVVQIEARFKFQLMDRPHHGDALWLITVRDLYSEYKKVRDSLKK